MIEIDLEGSSFGKVQLLINPNERSKLRMHSGMIPTVQITPTRQPYSLCCHFHQAVGLFLPNPNRQSKTGLRNSPAQTNSSTNYRNIKAFLSSFNLPCACVLVDIFLFAVHPLRSESHSSRNQIDYYLLNFELISSGSQVASSGFRWLGGLFVGCVWFWGFSRCLIFGWQVSAALIMSFGRNHPPCKVAMYDNGRSYFNGIGTYDYGWPKFANMNDPRLRNYSNMPYGFEESRHQYSSNNNLVNSNANAAPSFKRRRVSSSSWEACGSSYQTYTANDHVVPSLPTITVPRVDTIRANANTCATTSGKRDRSKLEEEDGVFLSRDEIDERSPSRKDGIDALQEKQLRYSYCAFIQNHGLRLNLPQSTVGTAMVLCHRFFVRRSHACHDRFIIATASLFLAAKSEETARPLNNVLRVSCEILHKQDLSLLSYMLPSGWFEQYRERVLDAENLILTTLNFELNVKHPYAPLTSILSKLGLAQSDMVKLALNLVSEGLRSSLWLQFQPHHIAAGAVYLACKLLNWDLSDLHCVWDEFQAWPAVLQDVAQQLNEVLQH